METLPKNGQSEAVREQLNPFRTDVPWFNAFQYSRAITVKWEKGKGNNGT